MSKVETVNSPPQGKSHPPRLGSKESKIVQHLRTFIGESGLEAKADLPSLRELADDFKCSVTPVLHAMRRLESEGLVTSKPGRGFSIARAGGSTRDDRPCQIHVVASAPATNFAGMEHAGRGLEKGIYEGLCSRPSSEFRFSVLPTRPDLEEFMSILDSVETGRPDVLILGLVENIERKVGNRLQKLFATGIPIVYYKARDVVEGLHSVSGRFDQGQELLTRYLFDQGHQSIVRFRGVKDAYFEEQKTAGFIRAFEAVGKTRAEAEESTVFVSEQMHFRGMNSVALEPVVGQVAMLLATREPSALMAVTDRHAAAVRRALRILGRGDIEVVGYDGYWADRIGELKNQYDLEGEDLKSPVSVDRHMPEIGARMCEVAFDLVNNPNRLKASETLVEQSLILPESTQ